MDAGTGSDGCEQLRSELVKAYDCVCSVASWSVLRELHMAGNPENLALKGEKSRCQTQVLSACSVPMLPSAQSSQRRAVGFLLVFHSRQVFFNSLEQTAGCPFSLYTSLTKQSSCLLHSKTPFALPSIRKNELKPKDLPSDCSWALHCSHHLRSLPPAMGRSSFPLACIRTVTKVKDCYKRSGSGELSAYRQP